MSEIKNILIYNLCWFFCPHFLGRDMPNFLHDLTKNNFFRIKNTTESVER